MDGHDLTADSPATYPDGMTDECIDWIESRVGLTFVHGDYWGSIVRYSDSADGRVWFDKS